MVRVRSTEKQGVSLSSYEANAAGSRVYTQPSAHTSEYADSNKALYQWYNIACSKNVQ